MSAACACGIVGVNTTAAANSASTLDGRIDFAWTGIMGWPSVGNRWYGERIAEIVSQECNELKRWLRVRQHHRRCTERMGRSLLRRWRALRFDGNGLMDG